MVAVTAGGGVVVVVVGGTVVVVVVTTGAAAACFDRRIGPAAGEEHDAQHGEEHEGEATRDRDLDPPAPLGGTARDARVCCGRLGHGSSDYRTVKGRQDRRRGGAGAA